MVMEFEVRTTRAVSCSDHGQRPTPSQHSQCSQPAVAWSLGVVCFSAQGLDTSAAPPFAMAGLWCHCPTCPASSSPSVHLATQPLEASLS